MPTGYTAKLCEGEQSFEEFVWTCARSMGAMIMQRDDALGVARIEPEALSDFYVKRLAEDRAELARIRALSDEACDNEQRLELRERRERAEQSRAAAAIVRQRLDAMRSRVERWTPPTKDHEGLKSFMIEQLDETAKWDGMSFVSELAARSTSDWRDEKIECLERSIASTLEAQAKEARAVAARNKWVAELRRSVPHPGQVGNKPILPTSEPPR